jgi:hypothetical protein
VATRSGSTATRSTDSSAVGLAGWVFVTTKLSLSSGVWLVGGSSCLSITSPVSPSSRCPSRLFPRSTMSRGCRARRATCGSLPQRRGWPRGWNLGATRGVTPTGANDQDACPPIMRRCPAGRDLEFRLVVPTAYDGHVISACSGKGEVPRASRLSLMGYRALGRDRVPFSAHLCRLRWNVRPPAHPRWRSSPSGARTRAGWGSTRAPRDARGRAGA